MSPWAARATRPVPRISSPSTMLEMNDYSGGMDNFVSNDKFPVNNGGTNRWRLAQDARITTLGEYDTRKGFDIHSVAVGETKDDNQESVTGTADKTFNEQNWLAQKFTTVTGGRLPRVDIRLKNAASATGTVLVEIWSNSSGAPLTRLARSSIAASSITSSYAYHEVRFAQAPVLAAATDYWIVVTVQPAGSNSYSWSSTTSGTDAIASVNAGSSWSSTSYALNFKQYYATDAPVKGMDRLYKSDGTKVTLMAAGTVLYSVNDVTGALTAIKTGLNASATHYRFVIVNDKVYYVNGYDGLRKWDFTTESQVNSTNYTNIALHKGLLFLLIEGNKLVFSNFADYETFTSTDFIYVPSPKTGDNIASYKSLNGYLLIRTQNRCFILSGDDNATFRLDDAPDQKGTYTAETSVFDKNYNYFISDDGIYKSNGTQPELVSEAIYEAILRGTNKDDWCMAINKGRLYVWYASAGSSHNDSCYVINLNYGQNGRDVVESHDTDAFVCRAVSAYNDDDDLLVASSLIGQVYWQEKGSNDYCNLGGDINYLLESHYMTGQSPAVLKEYRSWVPRFGAQSGNYTIACEYAYDQRDNWTLQYDQDVQGVGPVWGDAGMVWGSFIWGASAEVQSQLYVPGEYRRTAVRYKHYAARQPQKFLGHTLVVQSRRLR